MPFIRLFHETVHGCFHGYSGNYSVNVETIFFTKTLEFLRKLPKKWN